MFQNMALAQAKRLVSTGDLSRTGSLTTAALQAARDGCRRQWAAMGTDERQVYVDVYNQRLAERRDAQMVAATTCAMERQPADQVVPRSHWG